jgi:hypothetical protein
VFRPVRSMMRAEQKIIEGGVAIAGPTRAMDARYRL